MTPHVDLVIVFRGSSKSFSKQEALENARKAEKQYSRLIETLKAAGLRAAGRRGEKQGHLVVLLSCPQNRLSHIMHRERESDFLHGLPISSVASFANHDPRSLTAADRLRLIHGYVTSATQDGGLGIIPESSDWDLVESVMALHDRKFNETWIRSWTTKQILSVQLGMIREQFGDSVALYFYFLSSYTRALLVPALLGIIFYLLGRPYSPVYSALVLLWSTIFVEWWRVRERVLSVRWGTRGSFRVEKRRVQYHAGFPWWKRELRMIASGPVILFFASILATLLTAIFVFEAFVTHLYTGPGKKYISFAPTVLFVALVPRVLAIYQASAQRLTAWENHAHQSTHTASLTLKTFALSAIVAYLGLALSAFVYVPFGEPIMNCVQCYLFEGYNGNWGDVLTGKLSGEAFQASLNGTETGTKMWLMGSGNARQKLNPSRLSDQMFAYTVTGQVINTFVEIGLPFVLRALSSFQANKGNNKNGGKKKRVVFEDEVPTNENGEKGETGGKEEREFLETVRKEVALLEYELFGDYSEMVTQFGYVALWSTIWPLAPVMALVNNFFELRSDAFKIVTYNRRPIPTRTDTIGPWLDALTFLTWLAALTNSALVYLFNPSNLTNGESRQVSYGNGNRRLLMTAILIALASSHGYLLMRGMVRHLVERIVWKGNLEVEEREKVELQVKQSYLSLAVDAGGGPAPPEESDKDGMDDAPFWDLDEGLEEIRRIVKEA